LSLLELTLKQLDIEKVVRVGTVVTLHPLISEKFKYTFSVDFKVPTSPELATTYSVCRTIEILPQPGKIGHLNETVNKDKEKFVRDAAALIIDQLEPLIDRECKRIAGRTRKVKRFKALIQQKVVNKRKKNGKKCSK
jgi:hypothetical protein